MTTVVYTDGACSGNPGPGGWAWAVEGGPFRSGAATRTTNQRMELQAVLDAVTTLTGPLEVRSDSTYVVNCFRDGWWEGWLKRGWLSSKKEPVANRDLWEPLISAVRAEPGRVRFTWVKGHGGDPMNDLVDRLAVGAAHRQAGASGHGAPDPSQLGPPDAPGRGRSTRTAATAGAGAAATAQQSAGSPAAGDPGADEDGAEARSGTRAAGSGPERARAALAASRGDGGPPAPEGRRVVVAGHRPPELDGGWEAGPVAAAVRRRLTDILSAKAALHPDLVVLTSMDLGSEQLGAEAARDAQIPFVAVLPYPDPHRRWPAGSRARFEGLLASARDVLLLDGRTPDGKAAVAAALRRRDAWLVSAAHEAVVVWDGEDPFLGRLVAALEERLGEEDVWRITPAELAASR